MFLGFAIQLAALAMANDGAILGFARKVVIRRLRA
jgi:hypothetical protein